MELKRTITCKTKMDKDSPAMVTTFTIVFPNEETMLECAYDAAIVKAQARYRAGTLANNGTYNVNAGTRAVIVPVNETNKTDKASLEAKYPGITLDEVVAWFCADAEEKGKMAANLAKKYIGK